MDLLLDTNAVLWAMFTPLRLTGRARLLITDWRNASLVSVASTWEIAIKVGQGKLDVPRDLSAWLPGMLVAHHLTPLPIAVHHTLAVERLPLHHRDPFDRLLIAQAKTEGLTIVTSDAQFERYDVPVVRC